MLSVAELEPDRDGNARNRLLELVLGDAWEREPS